MTTDRTLLQQALHSLEPAVDSDLGRLWVWPESAYETWMANTKEAIAALRARLAEPERTVTLPPLPQSLGYLTPTGRSPSFHYLERENEDGAPVFTAAQMRDYATECLRAAGIEVSKP